VNQGLGRWVCRVALSSLFAVEVVVALPAPASDAAGNRQSAGPQLPATGQMGGISCPSPTSCWAAGLTDPGRPDDQLEMVHWNGIGWKSVPSPLTGEDVAANQAPSGLSSFTCPSRNSCWATGSTDRRDLILHWNGRTWSVERSRGYESLSGVTCAPTGDCWAVGASLAHTGKYKGRGATWLSVILHRTAQGWLSVPSVNPGRASAEDGCTLPGRLDCYSNRLLSVACADVRLCWAAGVFTVQGGHNPEDRGEILGWNGARWSLVRTPDLEGDLTTVACSAKTRCWALGSSAVGQSPAHLVTLLWNGKSWSDVPSTTSSPLVSWSQGRTDLACRSDSNCWVVGVRYPGWCGATSTPIALHWNGRTWSDVVGTLPAGALLTGIAPLRSNDAWAVGRDTDGSQAIFHWDGTEWSAPAHGATVPTGGQGCSS
jgi:hypothetical protein